MTRVASVGASFSLALLGVYGRPDTQALNKQAYEQVASTIDLQSVGQLDTLHKALGLAAGVDLIGTSHSLGITMEAKPQGKNSGESSTSEKAENRKSESNG